MNKSLWAGMPMTLMTEVRTAKSRSRKMVLTQNQWVHCFYFSIPEKFFINSGGLRKILWSQKRWIGITRLDWKAIWLALHPNSKSYGLPFNALCPLTKLASFYLFKHPPLVDFLIFWYFAFTMWFVSLLAAFISGYFFPWKDHLTSLGTPETIRTLSYDETSTNSGLFIHYLIFSQAVDWW